MNATYDEFKSRVSKNRNMAPQVLENWAQGKIWLGSEAKKINLGNKQKCLIIIKQ